MLPSSQPFSPARRGSAALCPGSFAPLMPPGELDSTEVSFDQTKRTARSNDSAFWSCGSTFCSDGRCSDQTKRTARSNDRDNLYCGITFCFDVTFSDQTKRTARPNERASRSCGSTFCFDGRCSDQTKRAARSNDSAFWSCGSTFCSDRKCSDQTKRTARSNDSAFWFCDRTLCSIVWCKGLNSLCPLGPMAVAGMHGRPTNGTTSSTRKLLFRDTEGSVPRSPQRNSVFPGKAVIHTHGNPVAPGGLKHALSVLRRSTHGGVRMRRYGVLGPSRPIGSKRLLHHPSAGDWMPERPRPPDLLWL